MEATIQYTTEFFDNLSIFCKKQEEPEEVFTWVPETENDDILTEYSKLPKSPYNPIEYTRAERGSDEIEQSKDISSEEISSIET